MQDKIQQKDAVEVEVGTPDNPTQLETTEQFHYLLSSKFYGSTLQRIELINDTPTERKGFGLHFGNGNLLVFLADVNDPKEVEVRMIWNRQN